MTTWRIGTDARGEGRETRDRPHILVACQCAGFTLIEVVLVATLLVILLTASTPRFQQTVQRLRTEQTAFSLTQLLRYAHERAVSQGTIIVWVWEPETRRARLAAVAQDGQNQWLGDRTARSEPLAADLLISLLRDGAEVDRVSFFPDGTAEPAMLQIAQRDLVYTVTVDAATSQPTLSAGIAPR